MRCAKERGSCKSENSASLCGDCMRDFDLISAATSRKQARFCTRDRPIGGGCRSSPQGAHSSVWSELPAHNRLVPGSNPGGPIDVARKNLSE